MRMAIRVCRAIVPPFLLTLIQGLLGPGLAQEMLPDGGNVVAGAATISRIGNDALSIHQTSDRAIVDWHSFSVGAGQTVTFVQPGAGSAILNRVTSGTQSIIAGEILGNGQVFLVNPNGIFITASGAVSAQGFVASSLDIANADFMGADLRFHGNGASAKVANAGTITGESGGFAALLGGSVENSGTLIVPLGRIGLGAGESATLDHTGDGFLQVALPGGENGDDTAIAQSGTIAAEGGLVAIEAATARDAARNVVRLSGSVSAKTVSGRNGAIVFGAGGGGQLQVSARVDVSDADQGGGGEVRLSGATVQLEGAALDATSAGAQGGTVTILGDQISLGSTRIDVSGAQAGGTILIGGGPYGMGNFRRAQTVTVDSQTSLSADGHGVGSGGTVVLWSDFDTQFFGAISARAGAEGGDGGFAEVSSAGRLTYSGTADLRAGRGRAGDLLLDPYNITISSAADGGMAGFTANADDSNINTTTLQDALAMANVTVSTGGAGTQAGNITLLDALTWASGTQLTFDAANSITLSAPVNATGGGGLHLVAGNDITLNNAIGVGFGSGIGVLLHAGDTIIGNSGASITTQGQAVTLNSDRDGSGAGAIALTSTTITTNGGDITLGGSMDPATGAAWSSGADVSGVSLSGGSLAAAAGSISIAGRSNAAGYGIVLRDGASVSTSSGDIDLTGVGGTSGTYAIGVMMTTGGASVTSGDGDITVTGTGGTSTGQYAAGVRMHVDQSVIEATGSGSITITGVGGETAQNAHGVVVGSGPDSRVRTASGNLTIHGTARSADATFGTVIAQGGRAETGSGNLTITGIAPLGATADFQHELQGCACDPGAPVRAPCA